MRLLRAFATPLTIGAFAIMSVTGILMFFHLDSASNKAIHEWAGWALVTGVVLHVVTNWGPFKRYFLSGPIGRTIIAVGVIVLALSFVPFGGAKGPSPGSLALRAVTKAPIGDVAPLAGRPVTQLIDDLAKAGITLPGPDASIDSVTAKDRGLQAKAMAVLFGKR